MIDVNIKEQAKTYSIDILKDDISDLKKHIENIVGSQKYVVIISKKVFNLYKNELNLDKNFVFVLNDGEKEKNIKNYKKILDFCIKKQLLRMDFIVAIGGGVVGDIAGFVASSYMRGINLIQVPTTLLACVDSSVGGKVAINSDFGKNLIGAFYQPKAVLINPKFLKTLSLKELKCGLGEVVKYAFIENSCLYSEQFNLINLLNENYKSVLNFDIRFLTRIIEFCVKLKVSVVEKDEKENSLRKILNFGHTFGHAVEKLTNYKYSHGECVVAGILFAFSLAKKNNLLDENYAFLANDLLSKFDFVNIKTPDYKKLLNQMKYDKKSTNDYIEFILPVEFATVKVFKTTDIFTIF